MFNMGTAPLSEAMQFVIVASVSYTGYGMVAQYYTNKLVSEKGSCIGFLQSLSISHNGFPNNS